MSTSPEHTQACSACRVGTRTQRQRVGTRASQCVHLRCVPQAYLEYLRLKKLRKQIIAKKEAEKKTAKKE